MDEFKYDIAISLCQQDIEYARKLTVALNPSLKVFFYEDKQEELIGKCGPEAFAKVFKEESRIVIILSRKEWSESIYTDIEEGAIVDRTTLNNQGHRFLFVIPMVPKQTPSWYPTTRIYADPRRFTIEDMARFVEFKVTEEGGIVVPVTAEDIASNFMEKLKVKRETIEAQKTEVAIDNLPTSLEDLKNTFNTKAKYFQNLTSFRTELQPFSEGVHFAFFAIKTFGLHCKIHNLEIGLELRDTQQIKVEFTLTRELESSDWNRKFSRHPSVFYRFLYTAEISGWSEPHNISKDMENSDNLYFYKDTFLNEWYDLRKPLRTKTLLDKWFSDLWKYVIDELQLVST